MLDIPLEGDSLTGLELKIKMPTTMILVSSIYFIAQKPQFPYLNMLLNHHSFNFFNSLTFLWCYYGATNHMLHIGIQYCEQCYFAVGIGVVVVVSQWNLEQVLLLRSCNKKFE